MPIALTLSDRQVDVLAAATKGRDIKWNNAGRNTIQLTAENWEEIRQAVLELHARKYAIKTKTIDHMETCYYAQQILEKFHHIEGELSRIPSANDNGSHGKPDHKVDLEAAAETIHELTEKVNETTDHINSVIEETDETSTEESDDDDIRD
jgi:methyl-accepting chemotaxis protein